jgi:hypothetical protein
MFSKQLASLMSRFMQGRSRLAISTRLGSTSQVVAAVRSIRFRGNFSSSNVIGRGAQTALVAAFNALNGLGIRFPGAQFRPGTTSGFGM